MITISVLFALVQSTLLYQQYFLISSCLVDPVGSFTLISPHVHLLKDVKDKARFRHHSTSSFVRRLFSAPNDDENYSDGNNNNNNNNDLDDLRKMLESSWNVDTMGKIPLNPLDSAEEAVESINSAKANGVNIFFVDLLLPNYDIKQGHTLYDEVLAVEYCIEISNLLKGGKSSILLRNEITLESVQRVINAREQEKMRERERLVPTPPPPPPSKEVTTTKSYADNNNDDNDDDDDDEDEIIGIDSASSEDSSDDLDAFRRQLMSTWDDSDSTTGDEVSQTSSMPKEEMIPTATTPTSENIPSSDAPTASEETEIIENTIEAKDSNDSIGFSSFDDDSSDDEEEIQRNYRLASLFGKSKISNGANMMEDIVQALRLNALPEEEEENIIILSAVSREEMVAVRILAEKYEGQKNIILVNCKLDPIPNELRRGDTVYSISPLFARKTGGGSSGGESESSPPPPKIVVMRRYPADWEVFVDVGTGFQLAETAPVVNQRTARGPPMDWVTSSVQRYLRRNA